MVDFATLGGRLLVEKLRLRKTCTLQNIETEYERFESPPQE
ncbi:integrase domain protein (plasmid) [Chlamydia psittaci MN]|nr:integrase domain protein [Chlamydia psittaci MN]